MTLNHMDTTDREYHNEYACWQTITGCQFNIPFQIWKMLLQIETAVHYVIQIHIRSYSYRQLNSTDSCLIRLNSERPH